MRILFMSHDGYLHGATRSLIDLADVLRSDMIQTLVFLPGPGPAEGTLQDLGISYEKVFYPQLISYGAPRPFSRQIHAMLSAIKHFPAVVRRVREAKPDVVYVNTLANYWVLLLRVFIKARIVFHIREFGRADHQMFFFMGSMLLKLFGRLPHLTICNSKSVAAFMNEHYGIRSKVVYNGVLLQEAFKRNYERKLLRESQHSGLRSINIGIVGNISKGKGQLEVVSSFHEVVKDIPDLRLYIVGDGDKAPIERYISKFGLENKVTITGFLSDVSEYYVLCDVIIVNSRKEAFGRVTVEAASFGIPVIAKNTGGSPEIIIDGKTGLLYDDSNTDLACKIKQLVVDPELRSTLGRNAWQHTKALFSLEKHSKEMQGLFTALVETSASAGKTETEIHYKQ